MVSFFLTLFFQASLSFANDESFCLLYSLLPEYSIKNELEDCKIKLTETDKEINSIKREDSITSLDKIKNTTFKGNNELISCEKELIAKIEELEDLRTIFNNKNVEISVK
jgi:hypothetical protein